MATASRDYWRQREQQHIAEMKGKESKYSEDIKRIYEQTLREIQKEIDSFYVKYAQDNDMTLAEAKKAVSKMDVQAFSDQAAKYVKYRDFSKEANEALKLYNATMKINRLELLKSQIALHLAGMGDETQKYIGDTLTGEAEAEARRQAGILGNTLDTVNTGDIKAVVDGSYHSDMSKSAFGRSTFSERIWGNNESLKHNLDTLLTRALINGKHPNALAADLRKQFGASQFEAERLMRTESARVQAEVAKQNQIENGFDSYEFIAEPTACEVCAALDGKKFKWSDAKIGVNMFPMHPMCRCSAAPVVDEEDYTGWLNFLDKGGTTAEWEAKKHEPNITKDLKEIEGTEGSILQGLEHRFKGRKRIIEKLQKNPDRKIRDALRYTYQLEDDNYASGIEEILSKLKEKGYNISAVRNYWGDPQNPYNGININLRLEDGYEFELQFHTAQSLKAKDKIHQIYEKQRILSDRHDPEYMKLNDEMFSIEDKVNVPKGAINIGK